LERRVALLEHPAEAAAPAAEPAKELETEGMLPGNLIPVAGRAVLGLAGAFLLRAVAESGAVPRLPVVCAAILYAAAWLVFSLRKRASNAVSAGIYGATAAMILAPLLWEATVRFQALPALATAAILIAYAGADSTSAITTVAALATAIGLMVQTGDLIPFAASLLAIGAISHRGKVRALAAIAADFAVWLVVYIGTRPGGVPAGYHPIALYAALGVCCALFGIYGVAVCRSAVQKLRTISIFEIVQVAIAFTLAAGGVLALTELRASAPLGAFCAIGSAACYFTAYLRFPGRASRNHHVFAAFGAAMGLGACYLILPESLLTWFWSAAAVVAAVARIRIHGAAYLLAAALISGLPAAIYSTFTGSAIPPVPAALWIVAVAAVCCYAADIAAPGARPVISLIPALFAAWATSALILSLLAPPPSLLATARTLVICAFTLGLSYFGGRSSRHELTWLGYAGIVLGALKLFAEDFRNSPPAALAVSLLCYGALLIVVPKLRAKTAKAI
jgi:hypothetical protein